MRLKNWFVLTVLALSLATWTEAGKGGPKGGAGGGGGGGSTSNTFSAAVLIDDSYDLASDNHGVYSDGVSGVSAEFVSTGNLLFKLGTSVREATVDLGDCTALAGSDEYEETSQLLAQRWFSILGLTPKVKLDAGGQSLEGSFFGLQTGQFGFAELGIGLVPPPDNRAWSLRFDPLYGGDLAVAERESEVDWIVDTLNFDEQGALIGGRTAAIVRPPKKGNGPKVVVATCPGLSVRFSVTCDPDADGACDVK